MAKAAPDGYTILMGTIGTNAINQTLYKSMPYQPLKDLVAVTQVVSYPLVVVVNPKLPINSVADLIAYAKSRPGELNRASGGSGTSMHMSGELFNEMAGIISSTSPLTRADCGVDRRDGRTGPIGRAGRPAFGGKLRHHHAQGSRHRRHETRPAMMTSWIGVSHRRARRALVDRLQQEIAALADPNKAQLTSQAADPVASTPDEFARFTTEETERRRAGQASALRSYWARTPRACARKATTWTCMNSSSPIFRS